MAGFKNRIFGQKVPSDVKKIIDDLQDSKKTINPLDPLQPSVVSHHLGESLPFARMWVAVDVRVSGSADEDADVMVFSVNDNREESYTNNLLESITSDVGSGNVKYVKQLSEKEIGVNNLDGNPYLKPAAGITNLNSKTEGVIGALQRTTVQFTVHNKQDFDNIFLPYFLRPGSTICVDFGRTFDNNLQLYDPMSLLSNEDTEMSRFDEFIYDEETGYLNQHFGYVKTVIGNVVKYDASINREGSFECSVEIVSRNTALIDKDITNDNNLKYIFNNIFDELLASMLNVYENKDDTKTNIDELYSREEIYTEIDFDTENKEFFKTTKIASKKIGKITTTASKIGIYHEAFSPITPTGDDQAAVTDGEKTYITLGRLEDIFLNQFVSGITIDKGENKKVFYADRDNNYELQYDSRLGLLRWDLNLYQLQLAKLTPGDSLPSFILPNDWSESYNTQLDPDYTPTEEEDVSDKPRFTAEELQDGAALLPRGNSNTKDPRYPSIRTMPVRELFISTDIIKSSFSGADTVEEALMKILNQINIDSNNIWNLKLDTANQSKTTFCVHDANLMDELPDLVFDVTSDKSIVSECNLKFVEAKGGLGNMIAISNMSGQNYVNQHFLSNLSALTALNKPVLSDGTPISDQFIRIKSLPFKGNFNESKNTESNVSVDKSRLKQFIKVSAKNSDVSVGGDWDDYIIAKNKKAKAKDEKIGELTGTTKKTIASEFKNKTKDGVILSRSERAFYLDNARRIHYGSSANTSIAPILPLELEISVYGNDWLQVGDCFNINYLPKYYKDKVMFQIVNVDHKLDTSGWQTSYTSIMKLLPQFKGIVHGPMPDLEFAIEDDGMGGEDPGNVPKNENSLADKVFGTGVSLTTVIELRKSLSISGTKVIFQDTGQSEPAILKFRVTQQEIVAPTSAQREVITGREASKISWYDNRIDDHNQLRYNDNMAYSLAIRDVMFELIIPKMENVEFSDENYNKLDGNNWIDYTQAEGGGIKGEFTDGRLQAVVGRMSEKQVLDIINYQDETPMMSTAEFGADIDEREKNFVQTVTQTIEYQEKFHKHDFDGFKKLTNYPNYVDDLVAGYELEYDPSILVGGVDYKFSSLIRNYSFSLGLRNTTGLEGYDFGSEHKLTFDLLTEGFQVHNSLTIPKIAFEDDNSILFFVKRMNQSYRFYKKMLDNFDKEYLRANTPVNDAPDGA